MGRRDLTLYGKPGSSYEINYKRSLFDTNWQFGWRVPLTNLFETFEGIERIEPQVYYRAQEFFAHPPLLQVHRASTNSFSLLLYGMAGSNYSIQAATQLWPTPSWSTMTNFVLPNSFRFMHGIPTTNRALFFQGRQP